MNFLRDRWRRTAFHQFFEGLEQIDRVTFWVAVALAFALGVSMIVIHGARESAVSSQPRLTAPPFEPQFAAAAR